MQRRPLSDPTPRAVAVVVRDGKVLVMMRRLDGRAYAVLPGGGIEEGERAGDAALRELREECSLDGALGDLLLEGEHGGRRASYFSILGVEGEPILGGEEAETQDESNQYQPMWVSPDELWLIGLLPEEIRQHVALWCEEAEVRDRGPGRRSGLRAVDSGCSPGQQDHCH